MYGDGLRRDPSAGELADRWAEELAARPAQSDLERAVRKMLGAPEVPVRKVATMLESLGEATFKPYRPPQAVDELAEALGILRKLIDARRGR